MMAFTLHDINGRFNVKILHIQQPRDSRKPNAKCNLISILLPFTKRNQKSSEEGKHLKFQPRLPTKKKKSSYKRPSHSFEKLVFMQNDDLKEGITFDTTRLTRHSCFFLLQPFLASWSSLKDTRSSYAFECLFSSLLPSFKMWCFFYSWGRKDTEEVLRRCIHRIFSLLHINFLLMSLASSSFLSFFEATPQKHERSFSQYHYKQSKNVHGKQQEKTHKERSDQRLPCSKQRIQEHMYCFFAIYVRHHALLLCCFFVFWMKNRDDASNDDTQEWECMSREYPWQEFSFILRCWLLLQSRVSSRESWIIFSWFWSSSLWRKGFFLFFSRHTFLCQWIFLRVFPLYILRYLACDEESVVLRKAHKAEALANFSMEGSWKISHNCSHVKWVYPT